MTTENTVTTVTAREKFAKAHAGLITLPTIEKIAFGDEGHDIYDEPVEPTDDLIAAPGEFIKKDIEDISVVDTTTVRVLGALDFTEGIGRRVSSVGIYDSDGDLVGVKTFTPKNKDGDTCIEVTWDEQW